MNHYSESVPETERADDWRTKAACLGRWDEMHPDNDTNEIAAARAVCAGCPTAIARACFWDAVHTGDMEWGVRAGLRANERRAVVKELERRRQAAQQLPAAEGQDALIEVRKAAPRKSYPTLRQLFDGNTKRVIHGHLAWTGPAKVYFKGQSYNPKQVAFILDRGRNPLGRVLTTCSVSGCLLPVHIADDDERARCGTQPGYRRHLKRDEVACEPCRRANTDADNRLRRTGTSKVAA